MKYEVTGFHFNNNKLFWLCKKNFSDSGIDGKKPEIALATNTTVRNSSTLKKLLKSFANKY